MENNRRKKRSSGGDSFSFPSTPNQLEDSDFEFGSLTSPADHLFFNGQLQPHSFPLSQQQLQHYSVATTTSRTSSIGSKDSSLFSSRSNSTNSSCSSARTSSSDTSERRLFHSNINNRSMVSGRPNYGCSQRWQYITPMPASTLNRDASKRIRRRDDTQQGTKKNNEKNKEKKKKKNKLLKKKKKVVTLRFGQRIFRWFVIACRQCHAMEPSKAHNKRDIKLQEITTC